MIRRHVLDARRQVDRGKKLAVTAVGIGIGMVVLIFVVSPLVYAAIAKCAYSGC